MSGFNCPDRRKSGIFNRPMGLIAIIIGIIAAISAGHSKAATEATDNSRHFIMLDQPAAFQSALEAALK